MHVLHVYKDYPPVLGGVEQHLELVAGALAQRGLRVTVLVTGAGLKTTVTREGDVEVIRAGRLGTLASTPISPALVRHLLHLDPDLTHLHFPYPPAEVAQLLVGRRRPAVVYYHSDVVRQRFLGLLYRPLMWRFLRRADRVLASSEVYRTSSPVLRRLGDRCQVLPLPVDVERFAHPEPARLAAWTRRYPGPRVLFVGRLRYYKGLDHLIDAMAEVEATLLVVGRGPLEGRWRARAAASPAAGRIHFLGDLDAGELPAIYAAADLLALPSTRRSEAFGVVQLEAMAAGTPVITTELGTGSSVLHRDGATGL
ncbi:MAG: glycosyltransferase, partial [Acidobacteria bacterium]